MSGATNATNIAIKGVAAGDGARRAARRIAAATERAAVAKSTVGDPGTTAADVAAAVAAASLDAAPRQGGVAALLRMGELPHLGAVVMQRYRR